jgi:hypothetical protein
MADQSAQHGQRLDDEMEHEVEAIVRGAPVDARAREDLEIEPVDQSTVPLGDPEEDEHHLEIIERSELARFLRPSALPADADTVLAVATEEHAPDAVLTELAKLPAGVQFATVAEIWEALGHETEHRELAHDETEAASAIETAPEPEPEPAVGGTTSEPPHWVPAAPAAEGTPPPPTPVVAPVPEPPAPGLVRGAFVLGLELIRAGLGVADRAIETVERLVVR